MPEVQTRGMVPADRPQVEPLLDDAIGRGFWDPSRDLEGIVLVAVENGRVVGVASATIDPQPDGTTDGHLRLVAVDRSARRRRIATRLVSEVVGACEAQGATELVAYAWVYGSGGVAPLSGALERAGFAFERRIDGFYSGAIAEACPACGQSPCGCPADVYRRTTPHLPPHGLGI